MEIAFEALENANIPFSKIKDGDMVVFVAAGMDEGYSNFCLQIRDGLVLLLYARYIWVSGSSYIVCLTLSNIDFYPPR
jgi:hypothetical protein